jgi:glucose dehydrogenase
LSGVACRFSSGAVGLVVALLISGGILTWAGFNDPQEVNGTLSADATPAAPISDVADGDWSAYGRNQEGQRYSPLKQINADNVKNLKEAWVFRTGDLKQLTIRVKSPMKSRRLKWATRSICVPLTSACSRLTRPPVKKSGISIRSSTLTRLSST